MTDLRDDPRIDAVRQRIADRMGKGRDILGCNQRRIEAELAAVCATREAAARARMADSETWYELRRLYPSPGRLEGR